jgi:putative addiction module component (TIGR02574 family)
MNAELKRQLASLTPEEKEDAYYFLMPDVVPDEERETSPELIADLERRLAAHRADPSGSITLEEFKSRKFNRQ